MSVMQLKPESFKKNTYGIGTFSHKYNYGRTILSSDISPVFEILQSMNAKSYSERYEESLDYVPFKEVNIVKEHNNLSSLLKSLQCLYYNIELDKLTDEEKEALKFLKEHIEAIKNYLINQITEYKEAKWG